MTAPRIPRLATAWVAPLLAVAVLGSCGIPADHGPRAISPDSVPADEQTTVPTDDGETEPATLYFTRFDGDRNVLVETERRVPAGGSSSSPTPSTVLEELLAGPQDTDEPADVVTSIPAGTSLASTPMLRGDVLAVDLNTSISGVQGEGSVLAYGQMVCTVTELAEVASVRFSVEGVPVDPPTGEGEISDEPLTCDAYENVVGRARR